MISFSPVGNQPQVFSCQTRTLPFGLCGVWRSSTNLFAVLDGRGLDSVGPVGPGCTVVQVTYFGILVIYLIIYYFINNLFILFH